MDQRPVPDTGAPAASERASGDRLRGIIAGVFVVAGVAALGTWLVTTPAVATTAVDLMRDPQASLIMVTGGVAVIGMMLAWTHAGRAVVAVAGLAVVAQATAIVVMALGGVGVIGRSGAPAPLSAWPIVAGLAGVVGTITVVWGVAPRHTIGRRQVVGAVGATVLGVTAMGLPTTAVYAVGDPGGVARRAAPFVVDLVVGVVVAMLATSPLRARRTAAMGQAAAALALLGSHTWFEATVGSVELVGLPVVVVGMAAGTVLLVALTAGGASEVGTLPRTARQWDGDADPTAMGDDGEAPAVPRETTAVLNPVVGDQAATRAAHTTRHDGVDLHRDASGHADTAPDDRRAPSEVVDDDDATEVVDQVDDTISLRDRD